MVRTMIAMAPIIDARRIYTKGIIIVTRSFMISSTSYPWAGTQRFRVDSHFINVSPFNLLLGFDEVVLSEFLSSVTPVEYDP